VAVQRSLLIDRDVDLDSAVDLPRFHPALSQTSGWCPGMSRSPIRGLPNEILVRIFEHVVGQERSHARLCVAPGLVLMPAVLVCHKWKVRTPLSI
jgi:hypothetical protein